MPLSCIISDGMVLQRGKQTKVYGKTNKKEKLTIEFLGKTYETTANEEGMWEILLEDLEAGGPYEMTIIERGKRGTIKDILIGDVWLCSGQSNMELPCRRVMDLFEDEILSYSNPNIRQFLPKQTYNFHGPKEELECNSPWTSVTPDTALDFTAVGYFFAKELYEKYKIPIGLISAGVGGTPVEAWISEKSLEDFPKLKNLLHECKDDSYVEKVKKDDEKRISNWYEFIDLIDEGYKDESKRWYGESLDDSEWNEFFIPQSFEGTELEKINGSIWFRKEIDIPKSMIDMPARIYFGAIVDADFIYINGKLVGNTDYRYPPRKYDIPSGVLKEGKNIIAIRVFSKINIGGFIKDKAYKIIAKGEEIKLDGNWKYRVGCKMEPLEDQTFFQYKPTGLYNGLISPLRHYTIKGVIWYQGESNTCDTKGYEELFTRLIKEWRSAWNIGEFPFLFVQLANFLEPSKEYSENWAKIRDLQRRALKVNNTAMVVSIDLGEYNDLHPQNKKEVGRRLALAAQKIAYGEDVVYSGPLYESMEVLENKIYLNFSNIGSGLMIKENSLNQFFICGEDKNYVQASAEIEGNRVKVYNKNIKNPIGVRYCWADNPTNVTLYNKEGLPASPFTAI
ncbi:sialate O-acetylesterase [Clostridium sp. Sa3CVN1]|uniref:Sialate O-acetylesterase n=2 Tax=Clostridiaceae TaxID=31979 RepID=A0ABR8PTV9_9CLOT|nr:sialate O-acetylesterase [Clostridium cibarium]